jgi:hypothetical protein
MRISRAPAMLIVLFALAESGVGKIARVTIKTAAPSTR